MAQVLHIFLFEIRIAPLVCFAVPGVIDEEPPVFEVVSTSLPTPCGSRVELVATGVGLGGKIASNPSGSVKFSMTVSSVASAELPMILIIGGDEGSVF